MANEVTAVSGIAIASIEAINGKTDANIQAFNSFEFTGVIPYGGLSWATGGTYTSRSSNSFIGKLSDGIMVGGYT